MTVYTSILINFIVIYPHRWRPERETMTFLTTCRRPRMSWGLIARMTPRCPTRRRITSELVMINGLSRTERRQAVAGIAHIGGLNVTS